MTMRLSQDLPEWAKDAVHVTSEHHFSMLDRVKILFGWLPIYDCGVPCESPPGRTEADTRTCPGSPSRSTARAA